MLIPKLHRRDLAASQLSTQVFMLKYIKVLVEKRTKLALIKALVFSLHFNGQFHSSAVVSFCVPKQLQNTWCVFGNILGSLVFL